MNRFKWLNLVNSVPEEQLTEVHNIVQETANKTIPKRKKSKRAQWSSEEALQIAEECREAKTKGERERYIQWNTKFQKIARRDKNAFFNEQCSIIEENNKRGKTRDLFRKTGNIKGTFHSTMGTIKDKNGRDLVDPEKTKKKWKEYPEELYKKDLNELNCYHDVVITQSQAFGSLKSSGP